MQKNNSKFFSKTDLVLCYNTGGDWLIAIVTGGRGNNTLGKKFVQRFKNHFDLNGHGTTIKTELLAGITSFFTVAYIIVVNGTILADAGIPLDAAIIATILTSFVGCLLIGLWGNAPILLVPGMGVNAFFTFTIVHTVGLSWQEALAAVFVSGILFAIVAFTKLSSLLAQSVPSSLKEAITVGIGLFLTFIGLQKGGIVKASESTFVALGNLGSPHVLVTLLTLIIALFLFSRNVKGNFLISIVAGTVLAAIFGLVDFSSVKQIHFSFDFTSVGALSFQQFGSFSFWTSVFSLAMVIVFENMGILHGMLEKPEKFTRSFQANSLSVIAAGIFGTSPTVSSAESASGIAAGGKTGFTAIVAGFLFLPCIFLLPFVKLIPDSAIAPVLIIIGCLMLQNVGKIRFQDFSEGFPAFLIIALIPLTYSITDGIAFGFIAYPILKIALGKKQEVAMPVYIIAGLFLINFIVSAI